MATRTYLVGLYIFFYAAHQYGVRWQTRLQAHMTTEQYNCLLAVLAALAECLPLIAHSSPT